MVGLDGPDGRGRRRSTARCSTRPEPIVASFILDDQIEGEIEVPVYVQVAPTTLPKEVEEGLKKSDVIWVGVESERTRPHRSRRGSPTRTARSGLLSQREPGPEEQSVPGVPNAKELVVITRRKGRDTSLDRFPASYRVLEGPEWEEAAKALADKRKSRAGTPADSIKRWRSSADIAELTPVVQ